MQTDLVEKEIISFTSLKPSNKTSKVKKTLFLNEKNFSDRIVYRTKMGSKLNRIQERQKDYEIKLSKMKLNSDNKLFTKFLYECVKYENENNFNSVKTVL